MRLSDGVSVAGDEVLTGSNANLAVEEVSASQKRRAEDRACGRLRTLFSSKLDVIADAGAQKHPATNSNYADARISECRMAWRL